MKIVLTPLAKRVLIPSRLTVAASGIDTDTQKNIYGSGMTTLIISNEEMKNIMKVVKSLLECGLLTKSVSRTIENELKEQKGELFGVLLGTLGAREIGNMLASKGFIQLVKEQLEPVRIFNATSSNN